MASLYREPSMSSLLSPALKTVSDASEESLSDWLDKHQHIDPSTKTRIILVDSKTENNYKISVAFLVFVLEGEIDLSTKEIKNGSLHINVPLWGLVKMIDGISGNLGSTITRELPTDSPSIKGSLALSCDQAESNLVFKYDFVIKFLGDVGDKIPLFRLPAPGTTDSTEDHFSSYSRFLDHFSVESTSTPSSLPGQTFDQFLNQHWNNETQIFLVASYDSDSTPKVFNFRAGFLVCLELIGAVKHDYTVSGINLYLTVPLWGRVDLANFSGSLASDIQRNVKVSGVNGTVTLKLGPSKEVKIDLDLDIKSAGHIKGNLELFKPEFKE